MRAALAAVRALPIEQQGRALRLGICRTFTIETQLPALELALTVLPSRPMLTVADLENIEQELLAPESALRSANPDAVLVLWRLEELHPRLTFEHASMSVDERRQAVADLINRLRQLCESYASSGHAPLFLSTLPDSVAASGSVEIDHGARRAVTEFNRTLLDLASRFPLVRVFDFSGWAAATGREAFDLKMDLYARQAIASPALMSFAGAVADCMRPLVRTPAKVLALDLDNVLWGGVIGEDGIDGVKIGHDYPGNVYRRIQQHVLELKHQGVLLALVSKNNPSDVEQAFAGIPDMPLRLDHFAAVRINWQEKAANLDEVARELNVAADTIVFVDDQAFEREQVRFNAPSVRVLDTTDDPLNILRALLDCRDFDGASVTTEDTLRNADYLAQAGRRNAEDGSQDREGFLKTLGLQAAVAPVDERTIPRVVQMLAKTNQFNVTTQRHSESDVRRMLIAPGNVLLTLSLRDKFADQGIVGLAIAIGDRASGQVAMDSFLLSCRAIGRGAEHALWSSLLGELSRQGYSRVTASYHQTPRNEQVADLFLSLGMTSVQGASNGTREYALSLPAAFPSPSWIDVNG